MDQMIIFECLFSRYLYCMVESAP